MIVLDTNILLRFFLKDNLLQARKASDLISENINVLIPDVVLPELEYVLKSSYGFSRGEIIEMYEFLAARLTYGLTKEALKGIVIFKNSSLDMADCIIAAYSLKGYLASFDKKLLRLEGIQSYWD